MNAIALMHGRATRTLAVMIRMATAADGAAVARIYDPVVERTAISFEEEPPGPAEMARRIASVLGVAPWLLDERGGVVRGYAYASRHRERAAYRWSVDVAVYVDEAHRRAGVGAALYAKLIELLRLQGFYAAYAGITLPNRASVALHEAVGFRPVGIYRSVGYKLGAWHDVGWWQLDLRERANAPAFPKPLIEMRTDPAWLRVLDAAQSG
jgi:L-amino acid N-acyltransferase YncA